MERAEFLRLIVPRGASLEEHLRASWLVAATDEQAVRRGHTRLAHWQDLCNRFDANGFRRRLAASGIDLDDTSLAQRLRPKTLAASAPVPDWAEAAWRLVQRIMQPGPVQVELAPQDHPPPFCHLFAGLAAQHVGELREQVAGSAAIPPPVWQALGNQLVHELSRLFCQALQHEFSLFRLRRPAQAASEDDPTGQQHYRGFITHLQGGAVLTFALKYAGLTRQADRACEQWQRQHREMFARFTSVRHELATLLAAPVDDMHIEGLQPALSDRHNGGHSVTRVTLRQDRVVYYKPRPLALEAWLQDLLASATPDHDPLGRHLVPPLLDRGDHGWVVEARAGRPDLDAYYQQAGVAVAIAWVLGATDLHDENIVMGEHGPWIIDGEMFASPLPMHFSGSAISALNAAEQDTVLRSGLLPQWRSYDDGSQLQVNGLAGGRRFATGLRALTWAHVNTDRMARRVTPLTLEQANLGQAPAHEPADHEEALVAGFKAGCKMLAEHLSESQWPDWRARLARHPVRFLVRDTSVYCLLEQRLHDPRIGQTVLDTEIETEVLASTLLIDDRVPELMALFFAEKAAILQGDVPYFSIPADQIRWHAPNGATLQLFEHTGVSVIERNRNALLAGAAPLQESLIRATLFASRDPATQSSPTTITDPARHVRRPLNTPDPEQVARHLGDQLLAAAVQGETGALTWIAPQQCSAAGHMNVRALGAALHDGRAGIGLFLAALAAVGDEPRHRRAAHAVFDPMLAGEELRRRSEDLDGVRGGSVGRASLIYALHVAGRLLGETAWLEAANDLSIRLRATAFQANPCADWTTGLAGELVALQASTGPLPEGWKPAAMAAFAALARPGTDQASHWPPAGTGHASSGASHGAAGIAHALTRLFPDDAEATRLSQAALAFVDQHWCADDANWRPDLHHTCGQPLPDGWAHGAPGIVMMTRSLPQARQDRLAAARQRLATAPLMHWDSMSTGNAARINLWLAMDEHGLALRCARDMLARAGPQAAFCLPGNRFLNPGLFEGLAGIGYTLLRLNHARRLPCALLLEPVNDPV